jgi:hypothetical protein
MTWLSAERMGQAGPQTYVDVARPAPRLVWRLARTGGSPRVNRIRRSPGANHANFGTPAFAASWDSLSVLERWVASAARVDGGTLLAGYPHMREAATTRRPVVRRLRRDRVHREPGTRHDHRRSRRGLDRRRHDMDTGDSAAGGPEPLRHPTPGGEVSLAVSSANTARLMSLVTIQNCTVL